MYADEESGTHRGRGALVVDFVYMMVARKKMAVMDMPSVAIRRFSLVKGGQEASGWFLYVSPQRNLPGIWSGA